MRGSPAGSGAFNDSIALVEQIIRRISTDLDGTLMDTNYHHAIAWFRSLRQRNVTVPMWQIHRAIGMGGDRLVEHVAGHEVEVEHGDWLRERWKKEYEQFVDEVVPLSGARELLRAAKDAGFRVALASSGDPDHVSSYLDRLGAREIVDGWTTAADADSSKPAPDLVEVALAKVGGDRVVLVGDSVWDCAAAQRAGMPAVAVRTGGFSIDELRDAGAHTVFEDLPSVAEALPKLPFG